MSSRPLEIMAPAIEPSRSILDSFGFFFLVWIVASKSSRNEYLVEDSLLLCATIYFSDGFF